jgi:tetratricopeptide (TPR) repeat protein
MTLYRTRDVADTIGVSPSLVRSYARSGILSPTRGPRREYRFSFQDVVVLRTAKALADSGIHPRRIRRAMRTLKSRLPRGRSLAGVSIAAEGDTVVVQDEFAVWDPVSGQVHLDFSVAELAEAVAPLARRASEIQAASDAHRWMELAVDLEAVAPDEAGMAYERALGLDPSNADAHANLGRLHHEAGKLLHAEAHYRKALEVEADHATASFNLGVVLEDQGRVEEAVRVYENTLAATPDHAEAHFNLSRLYERTGNKAAALQHLATYKRIREGGS